MRVMAFASQKGGSGKTTLAGHIAVQAERAGAGPVAIIDTDPQGSLSDWTGPRKSESKSKESVPTAPRSAEKRVRVSLRLDVDRHLRMKLAATHLNRTLQSQFTQATDEYFERHTPDMLDAITLLRIRERGEKDGNESRRQASGSRDKGEH